MNMSAILASPEPETPQQQQQSQQQPAPPPAIPASPDHQAPASTTATPMPPVRRHDDDVSVSVAGSGTPKNDLEEPIYTSTTTSVRRNASGQTSSVYSGNKIRHLKKEDGIPLWRKDIQFDFLKLVFGDETRCFTKASDGTKGHTFADIYIDAMAKSSKCSKILKEKLLQDQDGAISMAMVCLLVNVGRMNTTLNFFPEMRAQLRTYHSIPALQAHQDPNAYKQLQDAPRLKSILKGATEDTPQPGTMEEIKACDIPRTNPVNLIFVMSQYAPKISEVHFPPPRDFFDLVMRPSLGSQSRAKAFLWLIWWYLESDFSKEDSLRNPFGPGEYESEDPDPDAVPLRVPALKNLTEEQTQMENIDTEDEKFFGERKRKERISILASEPSPAMTALKRARKEKGLTTGHGAHISDDEGSEMGSYHRPGAPPSIKNISVLQHETGSEYTRSPSPAASRGFQPVNTQSKPAGDMRINNLLNSDQIVPDQSPPHGIAIAPSPAAPPAKKGPGRGNWRRNKNKPETGGASSTPSGSRIVQENHHVPLLPNTGQINFASGVPSAPDYNGTPSGGGSFNVFSNKPAGQAMSPPQQPILASSSSYPLNAGGASLLSNGIAHIPTPSYQAQKRNRGVTQHQTAIMSHRKQQIDYTLDSRIRKAHHRFRRARENESAIIRAWKRIRTLDTAYDSEEESIRIKKARARGEKDEDDGATVGWGRGKGKAGEAEADAFQADVDAWRRPRCLYAGFVRAAGEKVDLGEESRTLAKSFRRLSRRLERWGEGALPAAAMMRRIDMEARGGFEQQRRLEEEYYDRMDVEDEPAPAARAPPKRQRKRRPPVVKTEQPSGSNGQLSHPPEEDVDGRDGAEGAELDEEDREMLGEVDADIDESEDEEGDAGDDVEMDD